MEKGMFYKKLEKKFTIFRMFLMFVVLPLIIPLSNYKINYNLYVIFTTITIIYFSIILYAAYSKKNNLMFILKYTIFFDIPIISLFIYLFGGTLSEGYLLYYLIILYNGVKYGYFGTIISLIESIIYYTIASIVQDNFDLNIFIIRIIYLITLTFVMYEINKQLKESHIKEKEAKELAYKDPLTQLPNRLLMSEKFEEFRVIYEKTGRSFAISLIDIDNFKNINDSKGHPFGDKVLQKLAKVFLQCLSEDDFICRFGGDEFIIFFADDNKNNLYKKALNISEKIRKNDFYGERITFSIGISIFKDKYTMIENISFADEAMYAAKNTGKNKVLFYEDLRFTIKYI